MKSAVQIQLFPNPEQQRMLLATMERFNSAATHAVNVGLDGGVRSGPTIQKRCYRELLDRFGLSSQMANRAICKAADWLHGDKPGRTAFKPNSPITYDQRILSFKDVDRISLWTLDGRQIIPMMYGEYKQEQCSRRRGEYDLIYRGKKFYLMAGIDVPDNR